MINIICENNFPVTRKWVKNKERKNHGTRNKLSIHIAFFPITQQPTVDQRLLIIEATQSYSGTPHSSELLPMSDQPNAETSAWQHTTLTRDRQTSMPPVGSEPGISASLWRQIHALNRAVTGIGLFTLLHLLNETNQAAFTNNCIVHRLFKCRRVSPMLTDTAFLKTVHPVLFNYTCLSGYLCIAETCSCFYEDWNFNSGKYLFTTDTK